MFASSSRVRKPLRTTAAPGQLRSLPLAGPVAVSRAFFLQRSTLSARDVEVTDATGRATLGCRQPWQLLASRVSCLGTFLACCFVAAGCACPELYCEDIVVFGYTTSVPYSSPTTFEAHLCRNAVCGTYEMAAVPLDEEDRSAYRCRATIDGVEVSNGGVSARFYGQCSGGEPKTWLLSGCFLSDIEQGGLKESDVFSLRLTNVTTGEVLLSVKQTASWEVFQARKECGRCLRGTLDVPNDARVSHPTTRSPSTRRRIPLPASSNPATRTSGRAMHSTTRAAARNGHKLARLRRRSRPREAACNTATAQSSNIASDAATLLLVEGGRARPVHSKRSG